MPLNLNRGVGLVNELFLDGFQSLQAIAFTHDMSEEPDCYSFSSFL